MGWLIDCCPDGTFFSIDDVDGYISTIEQETSLEETTVTPPTLSQALGARRQTKSVIHSNLLAHLTHCRDML